MAVRKNYAYSRGPCPVYLQIPQENPLELPPGHRRVKIELPGDRPVTVPDAKFDPTKNAVSTLAGTDCPCACCVDRFCLCDALPPKKKCPCWFCKREQGRKVTVNG